MEVNEILEFFYSLQWYDWMMLFALLPTLIVLLIFAFNLNKCLPSFDSTEEKMKNKQEKSKKNKH